LKKEKSLTNSKSESVDYKWLARVLAGIVAAVISWQVKTVDNRLSGLERDMARLSERITRIEAAVTSQVAKASNLDVLSTR
jgi:hypothetical protein